MMKTDYKIAFMVSVLAVAACTSDHEEGGSVETSAAQGNEIRIAVAGTSSYGITRSEGAVSYNNDYLKEEASWPGSENYFKVTARFSSELSKKYIDNYVMYNTYSNDVNPWQICTTDGTPKTYYWPASTAFDFFAYAPAMKGGAVHEPTIAENGMTVDAFDDANNRQTLTADLRAFRYGDQTDLKEVVYAYSTGQTYAKQGVTGVSLQFQHPLAAIVLRISGAFDQLLLNTVKFTSETTTKGSGIYHQGVGTCTPADTRWEIPESAAPADLNIDIYKIMNQTMYIGDIFEKPFLVIPQTLVDREGLEDLVMEISFQKKSAGPGYDAVKTVMLPITKKVTSWEAGKLYVYSLELGKDESVIVGCSVEAWNAHGSYTHIDIDSDN